jgi:hypothetical protein
LTRYKLGQKLIAQSYDSAAAFGGGKKMGINSRYLNHCCAHKLDVVMKHVPQ